MRSFVYRVNRSNGLSFSFLYSRFFSILFLILTTFSALIILMITLFSSIQLIKKEGMSLSNLISFGSGCLFIVWLMVNAMTSFHELPPALYYLFLSINTFVGYLILIFTSFLFSSFIYQIYRPFRHQHYILVLGSGLLNGETVTPLLAGRIDRAIQVFRRQKKNPPFLILSGGQGDDERVSESYAMKQYALSQGIDERYLLMEDQSKNTYENMLFSKQLIEEREGSLHHLRILFSTTNYHVFRAGIYANQVKLQANGIGAPTKFYFWLNALLREFIAILVMNKKIFIIGLFVSLALVLFLGAMSQESETLIRIIQLLKKWR